MSMSEHTRYRADVQPPQGVFLGADSSPSWVMFCASMIGLLAIMNLIHGIAAVSDSKFFVGEVQFVLGGLKTWGWVLILVSIAQGAASLAIAGQLAGARWAGVGIVAVNAIIQMLILPAYPWWIEPSLTLSQQGRAWTLAFAILAALLLACAATAWGRSRRRGIAAAASGRIDDRGDAPPDAADGPSPSVGDVSGWILLAFMTTISIMLLIWTKRQGWW